MIGRAAQGRPWMFREIDHFLRTGSLLPPPALDEIRQVLREHLLDHYAFHGEYVGVRTARKHIGWYIDGWCDARGVAGAGADPQRAPPGRLAGLRDAVNRAERPETQLALLEEFLHHADDESTVH
jgi:tRNA-dihydrouridine synthase